MYQPSFDFGLFDLPMFSALQAQEFGASTNFSANTPTPYADFSINQFLNILKTPNPQPFPSLSYPQSFDILPMIRFFQNGNADLPIPKRPDSVSVYPSGQLPPELQGKGPLPTKDSGKRGCNFFDMITFNCKPAILNEGNAQGSGPIVGDKPIVSNDETLGDNTYSLANIFKNLPSGAGVFLLAILALVLILLFVKK